MSYPLSPGGMYPLSTAPTGRSAGGLYPLPDALVAAIKSLNPTAYWKLDEASGNLANQMSGGWTATVTGSPDRVSAQNPIGRAITWSGSGQYATTSASIPTPTTSMSVLSMFSTTNAAASARAFMGRGGASQASWELRLGSNQTVVFNAYQSGYASHAVAAVSGAANDGAWHLAAGTFDGTTIRTYRDAATASSASLTGSWHKASTAAVQVAAFANGDLFPGTLAHCAYWADRVLSDAEIRWLHSIAFGGMT